MTRTLIIGDSVTEELPINEITELLSSHSLQALIMVYS